MHKTLQELFDILDNANTKNMGDLLKVLRVAGVPNHFRLDIIIMWKTGIKK